MSDTLRTLVLLMTLSSVYIIICPFTKVEESFNLQATHDILYYGTDLDKYDHHNCPGVVPRSFIGPLMLSVVSFPMKHMTELMGLPKIYVQFAVRYALGLLVLVGLAQFTSSLKRLFGESFGMWYLAITLSQFHFMFYSSRTLPNIFACVFVLQAYTSWVEKRNFSFIFFSAVAVVIFRGELALLLGLIVLMDLLVQAQTLTSVIKQGLIALPITLTATVLIDSWFWKRWLWPEGEVLFFNLVLNKSSDWGVSPWPWYFYSAIPRALCISTFLVPLGIILDKRAWKFIIPALAFVFLYSFLPHKELRFIIYSFPMLNVGAACACQRLWHNREKSALNLVIAVSVGLHLVVNFMISSAMIYISSHNYPGGEAMKTIHEIVPFNANVNLHLDNLACQTGVSRFTQLNNDWSYNKTENLDWTQKTKFSHLVVEAKEEAVKSGIKAQFEMLATVNCFDGIKFSYKSLPPFKVKLKQCLHLMKKK